MIDRLRLWRVLAVLISIGLLYSLPASAGWEWKDKKELNLSSPVLDISESLDGEWLFILTPKTVLIYSIPENQTRRRIPLDKTYDRLIYSSQNNTLMLSSRSEKAVKVIQLEVIHQIDVSGRPFIGPENAPLALAVFFDYQ